MNDLRRFPEETGNLPLARVRRRSWMVSIVWIVPLVAAIVAGYLVYDRVRQTGPEIQALPGSGDSMSEFSGLESAPAALEVQGLRVILRASHLGAPQRNSPVYYRGIEVGVVQETDLSPDATSPEVHVIVKQRYARLVRTDSVFWNASGASVHAGLFSGLDLKLESLKALAAGGVAFATAGSSNASRAKPGAVFTLNPEPKKEWLEWAPQIKIRAEKR